MSFSLGTNVSVVIGVNRVLRTAWTQSFINQSLPIVGMILTAAPPESSRAMRLDIDAATSHQETLSVVGPPAFV
jgi:hypothetical protein